MKPTHMNHNVSVHTRDYKEHISARRLFDMITEIQSVVKSIQVDEFAVDDRVLTIVWPAKFTFPKITDENVQPLIAAELVFLDSKGELFFMFSYTKGDNGREMPRTQEWLTVAEAKVWMIGIDAFECLNSYPHPKKADREIFQKRYDAAMELL